MIGGVLIFVVAILIVIMVHETGHFLVAKLFGFKATKFFLGFGPTLWSRQKGETEYGIKALPLGGFVKIIGMSPYEEIPPEDESRSYPNKPRWQRALLLAAGSATHWVVAFVLLVVAAAAFGFPVREPTNEIAIVEEKILDGVETAAWDAGFQPEDRIVAVGGTATTDWDEIVDYIHAHGGETGTFTVERDGERVNIEVLLGEGIFKTRNDELVTAAAPGEPLTEEPGPGEYVAGFLGVSPELAVEKRAIGDAIVFAGGSVARFTAASVTTLPEIFAPVFNGELWRSLTEEGERGQEGAVGLVGASRVAGRAAEAGMFAELLSFIAGLTIFIGLMNLLPLPPLDGGHLAVLAYEKITGRIVDVRKLIPLAAAVISFFVILFIAVLYLDLARPIDIPF